MTSYGNGAVADEIQFSDISTAAFFAEIFAVCCVEHHINTVVTVKKTAMPRVIETCCCVLAEERYCALDPATGIHRVIARKCQNSHAVSA